MSGTKKIYICDNGIGKYIGKCDEGNMLENSVFNNLINCGEIRYYEKRSGGEIDFILTEKNVALEVKHKGDERDYIRLKRIALGLGLKKAYVGSEHFIDKRGFAIASDV